MPWFENAVSFQHKMIDFEYHTCVWYAHDPRRFRRSFIVIIVKERSSSCSYHACLHLHSHTGSFLPDNAHTDAVPQSQQPSATR